MTRWWRSTVRTRLTLLYAGAFFLAGAVLVVFLYVYLGQAFGHQVPGRTELHSADGTVEQLQALFDEERKDVLRSMLIASLASLGVVGLLAGALGWLLAGRALRPLRDITTTARRVADRSLHERIALDGPEDELKDLADTFDAMLERLDRSFDSQRWFVANASHELRTPLTINRTLIEVALEGPDAPAPLTQLGTTLLAVNQRHERLIDGLLTLASSEDRLSVRRTVDLADVVRHVGDEMRGSAGEAGVDVHTPPEPARVEGDPILLERLVHNLIDNAVRYNAIDDRWVAVRCRTNDGHAELTVENPGPVVPPYETLSLFEPFSRLESTERLAANGSSRGAGLGLSIVRSVAHAHGGEVRLEPHFGGGLFVLVRLPSSGTPAGEADHVEGSAAGMRFRPFS